MTVKHEGSPPQWSRTRRLLYSLLRFVISFGAIGLVLYLFRAQLPAVLLQLRHLDPGYFLAAVGLYFTSIIFVACRLRLVLRVQKTYLSLPQSYYVNIIAVFFNNILPSHVGGEMVKAYYIYRSSTGGLTSFSAVAVDRLFGLVTMLVIGAAAVLLGDRTFASPKIVGSLATLAGAAGLLAVLIFNNRIAALLLNMHLPFVPVFILEKLKELYGAMYHYRGHTRIILSCVLLTVIAQGIFILANFMLAESLAANIPLGFFFFFVPIMLLLGLAPSVNGIGVREAAYLFYLAEFSSPDQALALALLTSFFMILVGIIGGIFYACHGGLPAPPANGA